MRIAALALIAILATSVFSIVQTAKAETTFVTIEADNQPYGIDCTAPDTVYLALNQGGKVGRIDKATKAPSVLVSPTGDDFYSIVYEPTTNALFVNEMTSGDVWQYQIGTSQWDEFTILENPADTTESFQQLIVDGDGNVWSALGVRGGSWGGLVKINATTLEVTRILIDGAKAPSALELDIGDSNIIWVADRGTNELYKFNIAKESVELTRSIPLQSGQGSNVHDMEDDDTFLYIGLAYTGTPEDGADNSLIRKVNKATGSASTIDTGALNLGEGVWGLHLVDSDKHLLYWSDNSGHNGVINLETNAKLWENTGATVDNNYFICDVNDEAWMSAKGSAKVGIIEEQATSFELIETARVKNINNANDRKDVEVVLTASFNCDPDQHVWRITKTLKATIEIDGVKQNANKVTFKQSADNAFTWSATQSWGKVNGKSTFPTDIDCHNDINEEFTTINNTMKLVKDGKTYQRLSTTDNAVMTFEE